MKRDLELIRKILLWAEQNCDGRHDIMAPFIHIDGATPIEIDFQLRLLRDEKLIVYEGRKLKIVTRWVHFTRLTSKGYDLLHALKNDSIWNQLLEKFKDESLSSICKIAFALGEKYLML